MERKKQLKTATGEEGLSIYLQRKTGVTADREHTGRFYFVDHTAYSTVRIVHYEGQLWERPRLDDGNVCCDSAGPDARGRPSLHK